MEENTDYQIIRLPNTYYRIHIKKHMFSEDTWEHSMCIYGKKKALGKYTLSNSVIYKAFINLLNSYSTVTYEFMNCMAATEKWIRILNHVDSLKMTFVSANSFRFENDGTWRFYGFRHVYQKENHDISSVYISKNDSTAYFMDGGGFHIINMYIKRIICLMSYIHRCGIDIKSIGVSFNEKLKFSCIFRQI